MPKLQQQKYRLINLAGQHVLQIPEGHKPDSHGKVPCWDSTDARWRLVSKKWLVPLEG